jgi:hypothetical protein
MAGGLTLSLAADSELASPRSDETGSHVFGSTSPRASHGERVSGAANPPPGWSRHAFLISDDEMRVIEARNGF